MGMGVEMGMGSIWERWMGMGLISRCFHLVISCSAHFRQPLIFGTNCQFNAQSEGRQSASEGGRGVRASSSSSSLKSCPGWQAASSSLVQDRQTMAENVPRVILVVSEVIQKAEGDPKIAQDDLRNSLGRPVGVVVRLVMSGWQGECPDDVAWAHDRRCQGPRKAAGRPARTAAR